MILQLFHFIWALRLIHKIECQGSLEKLTSLRSQLQIIAIQTKVPLKQLQELTGLLYNRFNGTTSCRLVDWASDSNLELFTDNTGALN